MTRLTASASCLITTLLLPLFVLATPELPLITDAPKFEPQLEVRELVERQNGNPLIGYQLAGDTNYVTYTCNAGTFSTSGSWGICCPYASCYYGTRCQGSQIFYDRTSFVSNCNTGGGGLGLCYTVTLYKSTGDQSPLHMFNCESNWVATLNTGVGAAVTNTNNFPLTNSASTTTSTDPNGSSSSGTSSSRSSVSGSATSAGAVAGGISSTGQTTITTEKKSNAGLIAGAVIGGIAAVALVGIAILLAIRHGKKNKTSANGAVPTGGAGMADPKYGSAPGSAPPGYVEPFKDGGMQQQQYGQAQVPYGQQQQQPYYGTPQYPAEVQGSQMYGQHAQGVVPQHQELMGTPVGSGYPNNAHEMAANPK